MLNQTLEGQPPVMDAGLDMPGFAVVNARSFLGSVPDLSEQIKPIADNVFAVANARPTGSAVEAVRYPPSRAEPTLELDPRELRNGHAALARRAAAETGDSFLARRLTLYGIVLALLVTAGGAAFGFRKELSGGIRKLVRGRGSGAQKLAASPPVLGPVWAKFPPLPDPQLTPGEVDQPRAPDTIPAIVQKKVLDNYRIEPGSQVTVVCRLVPAELGGTSSSQNLFPLSQTHAELKSRLDRTLIAEWKAGKISKYEAVWEISNDWLELAKSRSLHTVAKPAAAPAFAATGVRPNAVRGTGRSVRRGKPLSIRSGRARASRRTRAAPVTVRTSLPGELTAELSRSAGP